MVYQLKIQLKGVTKPPVWRIIEVHSDITLDQLHFYIQGAMGWECCHLYSFEVERDEYGVPDGFGEFKDSRKMKLDKALKKVKSSIRYEYDFGDSWQHEITLEQMLPDDKSILYPRLLKAKGNCPPEDCGGVPGYENLKIVMKNPDCKEYNNLTEWLGSNEWDADTVAIEELEMDMRAYKGEISPDSSF